MTTDFYKYLSNDEREMLALSEQLDMLWEAQERIEKHDVREHIPTYLLSNQSVSD